MIHHIGIQIALLQLIKQKQIFEYLHNQLNKRQYINISRDYIINRMRLEIKFIQLLLIFVIMKMTGIYNYNTTLDYNDNCPQMQFEHNVCGNVPFVKKNYDQQYQDVYFNDLISRIRNPQEQSVNYRKYKDLFEKKNYKQKYNTNQINALISELKKLKNQNKLKLEIWSHKEIVVLIWLVQKYDMIILKSPQKFADEDWEYIAKMIPSKNTQQCKFKWIQFQKYNVNDYPWTPQQNQMLNRLVLQLKQDWKQISRRLYKLTDSTQKQGQWKVYRTPKQCKIHHRCHLTEQIKKEKWTLNQDIRLLELYLQKKRKWLQISKDIKGRTQYAVKNRFITLVKKFKISEKQQQLLIELIKQYISNHQANQMLFQIKNTPSNDSNEIYITETLNQQKQQLQQVIQQSVVPKLPEKSISNSKSFSDNTVSGAKFVIFRKLGITQIIKQLTNGEVYSGVFYNQNYDIKIKRIKPGEKQDLPRQSEPKLNLQQPDIFQFFQYQQDEQLFQLFQQNNEVIDQQCPQ